MVITGDNGYNQLLPNIHSINRVTSTYNWQRAINIPHLLRMTGQIINCSVVEPGQTNLEFHEEFCSAAKVDQCSMHA